MPNYELLRNVPVTVEATRNESNHPIAIATIAGAYEHRFSSKSRVSKALDNMSPDELGERLSGGHYFIVDDGLVDFRDGKYNGFIHTDESISHLVDVLGITPVDQRNRRSRVRMQRNLVSHDWNLGTKWGEHGISVPGYQEGGEYTSELHFAWNPFVKTVHSAFMLWRLLCTNGMEGLTSLLNSKIPLVNRWEEHLDIAHLQLQNKVDGMMTRRLAAMGDERATVQEVLLVAHHATKRLLGGTEVSLDAVERLNGIRNAADPITHCGGIYKNGVFQDKRLAAQMPAHLSTYDVFNMVTEMRTHTPECDASTEHALDRMANHIVFDREDTTTMAQRYQKAPQLASFSDPDQAFFGTIH